MNTTVKTDLSSFDNSDYQVGKSKLIVFLWYFFNVIFFINPLNPFSGLKVVLLRLFGAEIGQNVTIKPAVSIKYPWKLVVGNHVWLGEKVWIDNLDQVKIADNCCISQGTLLLCGSHDFTRSSFDLKTGKITLEEGVWIGAKSIIYKNTNCGSHSVLAMNSVVVTDLESYWVYRGNPAEKIFERKITD